MCRRGLDRHQGARGRSQRPTARRRARAGPAVPTAAVPTVLAGRRPVPAVPTWEPRLQRGQRGLTLPQCLHHVQLLLQGRHRDTELRQAADGEGAVAPCGSERGGSHLGEALLRRALWSRVPCSEIVRAALSSARDHLHLVALIVGHSVRSTDCCLLLSPRSLDRCVSGPLDPRLPRRPPTSGACPDAGCRGLQAPTGVPREPETQRGPGASRAWHVLVRALAPSAG